MINEISYSLENLTLDLKQMSALLGYPDSLLPEPFDLYLEQALTESRFLCDIRGAWILKEIRFCENGKQIEVEDVDFGLGKTVIRELQGSALAAFFICTAGEGISRRSQELLKGDDPVLGYVFDLLGSLIVESATDQLQAEIQEAARSKGMGITNRYSPGYCKWNVADQHKLFSFFPEGCCGISLTKSALMHPIKSVSGIIGVGEHVRFREYMCALCNQLDCIHRNHHNMIR
jgi:Methionine synthase I, cobalamin-binding domain